MPTSKFGSGLFNTGAAGLNLPQTPEYGGMYLQALNNAQQQKQAEEQRKKTFLSSYLETIPGGVYQSWLSGLGPQYSRYYGGLMGDFWNEYQGQMAKSAGTGTGLTAPQLTFSDFLNTINLPERYKSLTSRQKGFYNPAVAPRTRVLNY